MTMPIHPAAIFLSASSIRGIHEGSMRTRKSPKHSRDAYKNLHKASRLVVNGNDSLCARGISLRDDLPRWHAEHLSAYEWCSLASAQSRGPVFPPGAPSSGSLPQVAGAANGKRTQATRPAHLRRLSQWEHGAP